MADSENSRTLPSITRRNILSAAVISLPALAASPSLGAPFNDLAGKRTDDPTLLLWREWVTAHESYVKAYHLQWDLGTKLYGLTDGHEIEIHLPSQRATFCASTAEEIDDFLGGRPEMAEAYAAARDRLAARHLEWDEADERIGYSLAVGMEKEACDLRLKLAKALWNTPAQSVTGAAAKLHSFIEMKTPVAAWRKGLHPALRRLKNLHGRSSVPSLPISSKLMGDRIVVDSRNIETSSSITRRNLLSVAVTSLTASAAPPPSDMATSDSDGAHSDPAILLWREWSAAHRCRYVLCLRQQKLETKLLTMIGSFPQVELRIPGKNGTVSVTTNKEIDRLLSGTEMSGSRKQAKAELSARRRAWKAADAQIGYTLAYKAETEMVDTEATLVEALWSTPAQSIAGVTAKLHSVIETQDPGACLSETPWPELRLILADLLKIDTSRPRR